MLVVAITGLTAGGTVDLLPSDDTFTKPAGGCNGSLNHLDLANRPSSGHPDERVMILWDLSEYMGATVESATLYTNAFFQCPSGAGTFTKFYHATESWDESWSGAHVQHGTTSWLSHHYSTLGWTGVDVTDLVQEWLGGSIENHGIVLQVSGVYPWTKFHSREVSGNSPYLRLELPEALNQGTWGSIKAALDL